MIFKPRRGHFSRFLMGAAFLVCGLLLSTVHLAAGGVFLALAAIVFYYAPRWNLRIEIADGALDFSENVLETRAVRLALADLAEIRRVEEKDERHGLFSLRPEYHEYVEFETRSGKVYRMHDIFEQALDDEILRLGPPAGVRLDAFPAEDGEEGAQPDEA